MVWNAGVQGNLPKAYFLTSWLRQKPASYIRLIPQPNWPASQHFWQLRLLPLALAGHLDQTCH